MSSEHRVASSEHHRPAVASIWSRSRFGKLEVPGRSTDDLAAENVLTAAWSPRLQKNIPAVGRVIPNVPLRKTTSPRAIPAH
jgi:hypothetical protein